MNQEVSLSRHSNIFETLARWKVLSLLDLYKESDYPSSFRSFQKLILRLEGGGLLKSYRTNINLKKIVYLPAKYLNQYHPRSNFTVDMNTLRHDSLVSTVSIVLKYLRSFLNVSLPYEIQLKDVGIEPDAVFKTLVRGVTLNIGLEIELTPKSEKRMALQ